MNDEHENNNSSGKIRLEHVISFSDAVFAFSITFMAILIQIPNMTLNNAIQQEVVSALLKLRPQLETYALSFMIVGVFWISYHRVFNHIRISHSILIWLNLLFLFFVTLISFATALDLRYGRFHSVFIIYTSILTITSSILVIIWLHASKQNLLDKSVSKIQSKLMLYDLLIPTGIFMISIGVSFIDIRVAQYFWILIFVVKIIARKRFAKIIK